MRFILRNVASREERSWKRALKELADYLDGRVIGDEAVRVHGLASLDDAGEGQITFLANPKYAQKVATTGATAVSCLPAPTVAAKT